MRDGAVAFDTRKIAVLEYFNFISSHSGVKAASVDVQDVLRLLTLWYRYGAFDDVQAELERGFKTVPVDTWLVAIPQLMARIHVEDSFIVKPLKDLLVKIGRIHPEALMHPLLVRRHCPRRLGPGPLPSPAFLHAAAVLPGLHPVCLLL